MFWHKNIVLRFKRILLNWFIQFLYSVFKTFSSRVLTSKSLISVQMITLGLFWTKNETFVWIWRITLSLHFGKPKVPIFVPKCYTVLILAPKGPYRHWNDCIWTKTYYLNVLTQKYPITVPKDSFDLVYTIPLIFTQKFFLTCFDFKISHLGWNDYPWLVFDPKWNFSLDLKYNIVLAFWETKSSYFCSKMLYCTHFCPKRTVWTQRGLYLDQNIVLKCFDTEISYYGSKGFFWLGLPFLYSLLKTFSAHVLTLKSLIWVEMIILGLFWT